MQPLEILVQMDAEGRITVRHSATPLIVILGALDVAKVILTKPLVTEEKKVEAAPAAALRVLSGGH